MYTPLGEYIKKENARALGSAYFGLLSTGRTDGGGLGWIELYHLHDLIFRSDANCGVCDFAVFHDHEQRDARHAEHGGEITLFIDVDLADFDFVLVFLGDFRDDGREHTAGAAPACPEINQNWLVGFEDFLFKVFSSDV